MNRKKIKEQAKEIINGNLWTILKPYMIVLIINILVGVITGTIIRTDTVLGNLFETLIELALIPLSYGYTAFLLKYVRKEEINQSEVFKYYKNFAPIILLTILISIFTTLWTLLLIIPGIIAAISYQQAMFIMIDGEEDPKQCIKKSKEMMQGYKMDYFTFVLSFIGWILLTIVTFGLAAVYVFPYISVSQVLYYEELKKIQN